MLGIEWYHRGEVLLRRPRLLHGRLVRSGQQRRRLHPNAGLLAEHDQPARADGRRADAGRRRPDFRRPTRATSPARLRQRRLRRLHAGLQRPVQGWPNERPRSTSTATARRSYWPARAATTAVSTRRAIRRPATVTRACGCSRTATWGRSRMRVKRATPLDRRSVFGRATHELNDNLTRVRSSDLQQRRALDDRWRLLARDHGLVGAGSRRRAADSCRRSRRCSHSRDEDRSHGSNHSDRAVAVVPRDGFRRSDHDRRRNETCTRSWQVSKAPSANATGRGKLTSPRADRARACSSRTCRRCSAIGTSSPPPRAAFTLLGAPGNGTWGRGTFTQGRNYGQTCTSGLPIFANSSTLGAGQVSADCLESIAANTRSLTELDQDIAEFNLQGKIADMRAGELRFAVGAS